MNRIFTNKYQDALDYLETITTKPQTIDDITFGVPDDDQEKDESFEALQELVDTREPKLVEFNNNLEFVKKGYLYKCPNCGSYYIGLMRSPYYDKEVVQENFCSICSQYLDWSLVRYVEGLNFKR